jgi:uncharacterized protein (DUF486 family)
MSALFGNVPVIVQTALLLAISNVFMTFAWYAHLKNLSERPWWIAALVSWGIALFEYLVQVPANRIGHTELTLAQLKILQEVDHPHRFLFRSWWSICRNRSSSIIFGRVCVCLAPFISFFAAHDLLSQRTSPITLPELAPHEEARAKRSPC